MPENDEVNGGNQKLRALMFEAGYLKTDGSVGLKVFARAVGRHYGKTLSHTYVTRWLRGSVPRDVKMREAIQKALKEKLGRRVGLDEVGFRTVEKVAGDTGLRYPETGLDGVATLAKLWRADLAGAQELVTAPANISAWSEASLSWLVGVRHDAATGTGKRKVNAADIESIRDVTDMFDRLDGQHGGAHARRSLLEFLATDVPTFIGGSFAPDLGRELFRAVAQSTLLTAWMSYDAGLHGLAQRYFIQALGIAEDGGDRLLSASILDAMSHQATFLGKYREAATMTRAAQQGAASAGSHYALAHFSAMEARALARLGDAVGCDRAMARAVTEFERCDPDNDPADWFSYFNESELAAELGHCNRDLGRAVDASTYATQSLGPTSSGYVRSDFFVTMVLADAYLDQGEVEKACEVALQALEIGSRLKSARCRTYVGEFRQRLKNVGVNPVVKDFVEQASSTSLWTPQDSRTVPTLDDLHLT